jgi:hypothetical protein
MQCSHPTAAARWYPFVALHSEFVYKAFWSADNGTTALAGVPLPLAVQLSFDFVPMYQVTNARCRKVSDGTDGKLLIS